MPEAYSGPGKVQLKMPKWYKDEYSFSNEFFGCETTALVGAFGQVIQISEQESVYEISYEDVSEEAEFPVELEC